MTYKKLNLGCGTDIKKDWVNLDSIQLDGVDVVHNIEVLPLPFEDEQFDEIYCKDILEHVEYIGLMQELHRITKKGGEIYIRVPHFTSKINYIDPTHKKMFSIRTFDFFIQECIENEPVLYRNYYFNFHFSKKKETKVLLSTKIFYNYLIQPIINTSNRMMDFYEGSFLSRIFPAELIEFRIIK